MNREDANAMPNCDRDRSIIMWLVTQERVLRLWVEQAMAASYADDDLVRRIETHQRWLSRQIDELAERPAA